jgi:hypothetical protein
LYGLEAGYNLKLSTLTIRPLLGFGQYSVTTDEVVDGANAGHFVSYSKYFEPGVMGLLQLGTWLVGADASVLFLPDLEGAHGAFTFHGNGRNGPLLGAGSRV